ncbi:MAG: hypothetical protein ACI9MF_001067, partial [Gammaproteobacteria bacterium]
QVQYDLWLAEKNADDMEVEHLSAA